MGLAGDGHQVVAVQPDDGVGHRAGRHQVGPGARVQGQAHQLLAAHRRFEMGGGGAADTGEEAGGHDRLHERHRRHVEPVLLGHQHQLHQAGAVAAGDLGDAHGHAAHVDQLAPQLFVEPERLGLADPLGRALAGQCAGERVPDRLLLVAQREVGPSQDHLFGLAHQPAPVSPAARATATTSRPNGLDIGVVPAGAGRTVGP